jgi:hypothetical protein
MKKTPDYIVKDKVLNHLSNKANGSETITGLSNLLNYDYDLVCHCLDDLISKSLVDYIGITGNRHDKLITINPSGKVFLTSGGFAKKDLKIRLTNSWNLIKTIFVVANSIAILFIGFWGVQVSNKSYELEKINTENKQTLDSIRQYLNLHGNQISDTTKSVIIKKK